MDPATGFDGHIVPEQVRITSGYMLANDPRPFYVHQSNLAEGGLLYPVLTAVLGAYRSTFAGSAPVVEQTLTDAGGVLKNQASWTQPRTAGTVSAFRQGDVVTVSGPPGTVVPITVPAGTVLGAAGGSAFGASYGGELSAYQTLDGSALTLALPASAAGPQSVAPAPQPAPAVQAVPVPPNDRSGAERSVTADPAQDSAPQTLVVPSAAGPGAIGDAGVADQRGRLPPQLRRGQRLVRPAGAPVDPVEFAWSPSSPPATSRRCGSSRRT